MFELNHPWWEFCIRAAIVYVVLLVLVRATGKRTVGQFTPFDLIVVMLMSEAVSSSLNGQDESITGGLIAATTLILLNLVVVVISSRSEKADQLLQGKPVLIGRDGEIYKDILKRQRVSESEVEQALRENDCEIEDMRMAVLEADGKISILKKPDPQAGAANPGPQTSLL